MWCRRIQPESSTRDSRTQAIIMYLEQHLDQVVTIPELARFSGQSVSRLTHEFHRQMGVSPMQYLEQRRMDWAIELLSRNVMNIKNIAATPVGLENSSRKFGGTGLLPMKGSIFLETPDSGSRCAQKSSGLQ